MYFYGNEVLVTMLEWIAIITMLIDHIGYEYYPYELTWRSIGRLAFPIYTFLIIRGMELTNNRIKYLKRLLYLALISQIPFILLFEVYYLNVIFTLFYGAIAIFLFEKLTKIKGMAILVILGLIIAQFSNFTEYGLYAYLLLLNYYFFKEKPFALLACHAILDLLYNLNYFGSWYSIQSFSVIATVIILLKLPEIKIPRVFYRGFYPAHILILYLVSKLINN